MSYYCWIIANNFGLHNEITAINSIFEHVASKLEKERAVAGANNANHCSSFSR